MLTLDERPFSFNDMVGQDRTIRGMKKLSKNLNFAQVMLLEGPTGTGKTTMAYITAALINCHNPIDRGEYKDPCGECASCETVLDKSFARDIIFHDASQMGKDQVINLSHKSYMSPWFDKNKIYIIDEAQEMSRAAKGATLDLLERKRENVYFILNTTKIETFEKAVIDRCQRYKFKGVNYMVIAKYLAKIIKRKKIDVPDNFIEDGLFLIAGQAKGSVREAIQNLQKCIEEEIFEKEEICEEFDIEEEALI